VEPFRFVYRTLGFRGTHLGNRCLAETEKITFVKQSVYTIFVACPPSILRTFNEACSPDVVGMQHSQTENNFFVTTRPVTSLGHQEGRRVF